MKQKMLANKRVGIVTYIYSFNYGSTLQAFALQSAIESLGFSTYLIDFKDLKLHHNRVSKLINLIKKMGCLLFHPSAIIAEFKRIKSIKTSTSLEPLLKKDKFCSFFKELLHFSKENYFKNHFDYLVAGSDQIWKLSTPGLHNMFFLRFSKNATKIAYAPSFGSLTIPRYNLRLLKKYISDFDYISVREKSGIVIVNSLIQKNPIQVLDPVLLFEPSWWRKLCNKSKVRSNYILVYLLNGNDEALSFAETIAKQTKTNIINISSFNAIDNPCPGPLEFVKLIDNSFCFITDSFHGLAFSALMNTPFYVFNRKYLYSPEQSTRIESFLEMIGSVDRLLNSKDALYSDMDFSRINYILKEKRNESISFLKNALGQ